MFCIELCAVLGACAPEIGPLVLTGVVELALCSVEAIVLLFGASETGARIESLGTDGVPFLLPAVNDPLLCVLGTTLFGKLCADLDLLYCKMDGTDCEFMESPDFGVWESGSC